MDSLHSVPNLYPAVPPIPLSSPSLTYNTIAISTSARSSLHNCKNDCEKTLLLLLKGQDGQPLKIPPNDAMRGLAIQNAREECE